MRREISVLGVLACLSWTLTACDEEAPDKIVFGQACSLTGGWAVVTELTTQPIYTFTAAGAAMEIGYNPKLISLTMWGAISRASETPSSPRRWRG